MDYKEQSGFSIIEGLLILVVVGILGLTGWYVYHAKQASVKDYSAATNSTVPAYKNTNSYAGWKTANLQYEKVSFKYPSSWRLNNTSKDEQATGGTATPGADTAVLTSPNGLQVSLDSGVAGIGDSDGIDSVLPGAQHIQTLGDSYYLDFYAHNPDSTTVAQGACVDKSASATGMPYIASKNIQLANIIAPSADIGNPTADVFCIQFKNVAAEQQDMTLEHDASYKDALLIIESLSYSPTQKTYLDMKEVGVKFLLNSSVSDAVYAPYYVPSSDGATVFGISTKSIENDAGGVKYCTAPYGSLGIIRVTAAAPVVPFQSNPSDLQTPDNKTLFLIGGKYYQYVFPQDTPGCGSVTPDQEGAAAQAIEQSFTSLQPDTK